MASASFLICRSVLSIAYDDDDDDYGDGCMNMKMIMLKLSRHRKNELYVSTYSLCS